MDIAQSEFKVRLEFDHRFKVWIEIIHRNRRLHLRAAPSPEELRSLHERYKALDVADAERLNVRALTEFDYATEGNDNLFMVLGHYQVLQHRKSLIKNQLEYQLSFYERLIEYMIVQRSVFLLHQQKQISEV